MRSRSEAVSLLLDPSEPLGTSIGVVSAASAPLDALDR